MAINLDKMREKLAAVQNRGDSKSAFWRPDDGDQTIRIVPTKDEDPFKEVYFHYNVAKRALVGGAMERWLTRHFLALCLILITGILQTQKREQILYLLMESRQEHPFHKLSYNPDEGVVL